MRINPRRSGKALGIGAFTLVEVVISLAVAVVVIAGIIYGYTGSTRRAEWSGYSLAAHSLALQRLEQVRAAKFSSTGDEVISANFPATNGILDVSSSGQKMVYGTNITTITTVGTNLKCIKIDCIWAFSPRNRLFTNTLVTYRSRDF